MKIKLYKTATCPYCQMESEWLKENKVPFQEVYVDRDPAAAEELVDRSGQQGVPVTEVGEGETTEFVLGFNKPRLAKLLGLKS